MDTIQYFILAFLFFPLKYLGMKHLIFKYIPSRTASICTIPCILAAGISLVYGKLRHSSLLIKLQLKTHPKLKVISCLVT